MNYTKIAVDTVIFSERKKLVNVFFYLGVSLFVLTVIVINIMNNPFFKDNLFTQSSLNHLRFLIFNGIERLSGYAYFTQFAVCVFCNIKSKNVSSVFSVFAAIEFICLFGYIYFGYIAISVVIADLIFLFAGIITFINKFLYNNEYRLCKYTLDNIPEEEEKKAAKVRIKQYLKQNDAVGLSKFLKRSDEQAEIKRLFPTNYVDKPNVSPVTDFKNNENIFFDSETGFKAELKKLYTSVYKNKLYCLTEKVNSDGKQGGEFVLLRVEYQFDQVTVETDEIIRNAIIGKYKAYTKQTNGKASGKAAGQNALNGQNAENANMVLDLEDVSVDTKTWKKFRKTASHEELAIIAIGAQYRIIRRRIINIFFVAGIILSVVLFPYAEGWSLIGYPVFCFLATKSIRYQMTFDDCCRKLNASERKFVKSLFKDNFFIVVFDVILNLCITYITIPYQAILMFIGMYLPNFETKRNGVLIPLPKGCEFGNLKAAGEYYSQANFLNEFIQFAESKEKETYTLTDETGSTRTLTKFSGNTYKDDCGGYWKSDDGGYTFYRDK